MPQMSPLSWSTLMLMFLMLYILNTIKLYFTNVYQPLPAKPSLTLNKTSFYWKW